MKIFSGLRSRILLLLLFIVLPVLFMLFYSAYEQRQRAEEALKQEVAANVSILAGLMEQKVAGARSLLIAISHTREIRERDSASCNRLLAAILKQNPHYTNLGAADPGGNVFCSAIPMKRPVNASDKAWFQRTIKSREIVAGDYQIGRIIGQPVIILGYAARNEAGRVQTAIFAPFDLTGLSRISEQVKLPRSTVFLILDRNGTILSRSPDHEKWVGKTRESDLIKTILTQHEGLTEMKDIDGIKRIYCFTPIEGADNSLFMGLGIPKDVAFAEINRQVIRNLMLFGLLAAISFAAALIISRLARQSEKSLVESEERLHLLSENARDMIYRMSLPEGRYEYVSSASIALFGYAPEEFYNSPILIQKVIHPDWRAYFEEQWAKLLAGDMPPFYEYQIIDKSSKTKWLYQRNTLIRDAAGIPLAIEGIVTDITMRKQAEEAIIRNEQVLRLFVEHAPAAIAMFDHEMKYLVASRRYLIDYDLGEQNVVGRSHYEVFPEIPERWKEIHKRCLAGEMLRADEDLFPRASGKTDWVSWEIRPWYEQQGEIGGIILFSEVITERKQVELELKKHREHLEELVKERTTELKKIQYALTNIVEDLNLKTMELGQANIKLKDLDRLKSMFIASMSHELRTPLNSIIGFTGIILQGMAGELNKEQRDQLERVFRAGKHLLALITDVIDIAKIESGKMQPYAEEFLLADVMKEACESMKVQIQEKSLKLQKYVPDVPVRMNTDRRRFLQCLLNILSNAIKFTEKGSIKVSACEENESVRVSVSDTGIGVKPEEMQLLFKSFVRLKSHLMTTTPGTGLGLYLTRKIATEVLGGDVLAESIEGKGSTFSIVIPTNLITGKTHL